MNPTLRLLTLALGTTLTHLPAKAADFDDAAGITCKSVTVKKGQTVLGCSPDDDGRPTPPRLDHLHTTSAFPISWSSSFRDMARKFVGRGASSSASIYEGDDFATSPAALHQYMTLKERDGWAFIPAPSDAPHMETVFREKGSDFRRKLTSFLHGLVGTKERLEIKSNELISTNSIEGLNDALTAASTGAPEGVWKANTKHSAWCVVLPMLALHHTLDDVAGMPWPLPTKNVQFTAGWALQLEDMIKKAGLGDHRIVDMVGTGLLTASGAPMMMGDLVTTEGHSHMATLYGFMQRIGADGRIETKYVTIDGNFGPQAEEGIAFVIRDRLKGHINTELFTLAALDIKEDAIMQRVLQAEVAAERAAAAKTAAAGWRTKTAGLNR